MTAPSGGSSGGTTTTRQTYSPEEEAARAKIFAEGQQLYNQQQPGAGTYQGPGVVGFSEPSKQAFGTQLGIAGQAVPTAQEALRSANFNLNDARYVGSNPYAQDAIRAALDPIVRTHQTSTMPGLRLGAAQQNTGMSTRQGIAEGLATEALYRTLGNTASGMASGMYNSGLNASVATQGQLPQIMQGAQMPGLMQSQVGTALEQQAQAEENLAATKRLQQTQGPWELLQNWSSLVGGMSNPTTTTQQQGTGAGGGFNPMQLIGGGLSMAGMLGSLFSDENLKENILPVGKLNDGQKIYSYTYKGDSVPRIGLLAQEVAKVRPEAVHRDPSGFLKVNYGKATEKAAGLSALLDLTGGNDAMAA